MLEVYLFQVLFAVKILLLSILVPRRLLQRIQQGWDRKPAPRGEAWIARTLGRYRVAYGVVTVIGVMLMVRLFFYMQQADWSDGPVEAIAAFYTFLQVLPFIVLNVHTEYFKEWLRNSLPGERRKAVLQPRGLFDFVSPAVVVLTLLCYPLFVALVFYIQRDPFEGFAGPYVNIAIATAAYATAAFLVYHFLYRSKANPLQTHAERLLVMGIAVKLSVYWCLLHMVSTMINMSLILLDRQRLEPAAWCACELVMALLIYRSLAATPAQQTTDATRGDAVQ